MSTLRTSSLPSFPIKTNYEKLLLCASLSRHWSHSNWRFAELLQLSRLLGTSSNYISKPWSTPDDLNIPQSAFCGFSISSHRLLKKHAIKGQDLIKINNFTTPQRMCLSETGILFIYRLSFSFHCKAVAVGTQWLLTIDYWLLAQFGATSLTRLNSQWFHPPLLLHNQSVQLKR